MKRFIEHHELARDSRFTRQDDAAATILSKLPEDVDEAVAAFERLQPRIEASVKGTEAEPLEHFGGVNGDLVSGSAS